jgi:hypothetical protein
MVIWRAVGRKLGGSTVLIGVLAVVVQLRLVAADADLREVIGHVLRVVDHSTVIIGIGLLEWPILIVIKLFLVGVGGVLVGDVIGRG